MKRKVRVRLENGKEKDIASWRARGLIHRGVAEEVKTYNVSDLLLCSYGAISNAQWGYIPEYGTTLMSGDFENPQLGIFVYEAPVTRDDFLFNRELVDGDNYLHVATGKSMISTSYYYAYNNIFDGIICIDALRNRPIHITSRYKNLLHENGWDEGSRLTKEEVKYLESRIIECESKNEVATQRAYENTGEEIGI